MLYFRRLPTFMRIARIVGLLCFLTALVLVGWIGITGLPFDLHAEREFQRICAIAISLVPLGTAFSFPSTTYISHLRSPGTRAFALHSWQQQARTIALLAALPICALTLAYFIPWSPFADELSLALTVVAMVVDVGAYAWAASRPANPAERHSPSGQ